MQEIENLKFKDLGPVVLAPDNFTPLSRTPWAGGKIAKTIKKEVVAKLAGSVQKIGESWEFSSDSQFMSKIQPSGLSLSEFLQTDIQGILSEKLYHHRGQADYFTLLVKIIEASSPLSFQVHPDDHDPYLAENECGKPESWLVVDVEDGAGIYLGFNPGVTLSQLKDGLITGADIRHLMQFVRVKTGDYFDLAPGVPHAIGPGVTLLEPQRILPGLQGKTYRMWDWNRRYNLSGQLDMKNGKPRELHIEQSLRLVCPKAQSGYDYVETLRRIPEVLLLGKKSRWAKYPPNSYYQSHQLEIADTDNFQLCLENTYVVVVVIQGRLEVTWGDLAQEPCRRLVLEQGHTMLVPARVSRSSFMALGDCQTCLFHDSIGRIDLS